MFSRLGILFRVGMLVRESVSKELPRAVEDISAAICDNAWGICWCFTGIKEVQQVGSTGNKKFAKLYKNLCKEMFAQAQSGGRQGECVQTEKNSIWAGAVLFDKCVLSVACQSKETGLAVLLLSAVRLTMLGSDQAQGIAKKNANETFLSRQWDFAPVATAKLGDVTGIE